MQGNECLTEEVFNTVSNLAYAVPWWLAGPGEFKRSIALVGVAGTLRHLPRSWLSDTTLGIFKGADYTASGILLLALYANLSGHNNPIDYGRYLGWYIVLCNYMYWVFNPGFSWDIAVFYYVAPYYLLAQVAYKLQRKLLLCTLLVLGVLVRMAEYESVVTGLGFKETSNDCSPLHCIWTLVTAMLISIVLTSVNSAREVRYNAVYSWYDGLSHVTHYTVLHVGSGLAIGYVAAAVDAARWLAIASAMFFVLGWEVYEYWAAPATGYWHCRNAANTAFDIAAGLLAFVFAYDELLGSRWAYQVFYVFIGALISYTATQPTYNPERHTVSSSALNAVRRVRFSIPGERKAYRRRVELTQRLRTGKPVTAVLTTQALPDALDDDYELSPPHRWLAAMCATFVVVYAYIDVDCLPLDLAFATIGFCIQMPSHKIMEKEDNGERDDPEFWMMRYMPFYYSWPQNSPFQKRHGSRNRARYKFKSYCLPARFVLYSALLLGMAESGDTGKYVLEAFLGLTVLFTAYMSFVSSRQQTWWRAEYLLAEAIVSIVLLEVLDLQTAVVAIYCMLMIHWACSLHLASMWPKVATD